MSRRSEVKQYNDFMKQLLPRLGDGYSVTDKKAVKYDYIAYMLNRTQEMFIYTGLPETIPAGMLELLLQVNGYAAIAEHNGDLYAFFGGLGGVPDEYYRPTECIINNPALNFNLQGKIGENCIVIRNDSMYSGLMPMFAKYAELMTENDITFRVASINGRLASIISASDDRTKEAAIKYLEDIEDGQLGVIGETAFFDGVKVQTAADHQTQSVIDLIEYHQYLKASWYNDLGIQANFNMKREALTPEEVQLNVKALLPLAQNMLECRKEGVQAVNKLFGTNISVDFKSVWKDTEEEVEQKNQTLPEEDPEEQDAAQQEEDAAPEEAEETEEEESKDE